MVGESVSFKDKFKRDMGLKTRDDRWSDSCSQRQKFIPWPLGS